MRCNKIWVESSRCPRFRTIQTSLSSSCRIRTLCNQAKINSIQTKCYPNSSIPRPSSKTLTNSSESNLKHSPNQRVQSQKTVGEARAKSSSQSNSHPNSKPQEHLHRPIQLTSPLAILSHPSQGRSKESSPQAVPPSLHPSHQLQTKSD